MDRKLELAAVLATVRWWIETEGYPPTVREVAVELGVATSTAALALDELEAAGTVARTPGKARTLRIIEQALTAPEGEDA
jgi:SOS-response transcriptional repressor LexA